MPKKGTPKQPPWHWRDVIKVRQFADRGFSAREAGLLLTPVRTRAAVSLLASRLGIKFHATTTGAPKHNNNRRIGEARKALRAVLAAD